MDETKSGMEAIAETELAEWNGLVSELLNGIRDREVLLATILGAWEESRRLHGGSAAFCRWFEKNAAPQIKTALNMEGDRTNG